MNQNNNQIEQACIASIILDGGINTLDQCLEAKITPEAFYCPKNRLIYTAIIDLHGQGVTPIDEVILIDHLKKGGHYEQAGGDSHMIEVTSRVETSAGIIQYIGRLKDYHLMREITVACTTAIEMARDHSGDGDHLIEEIERMIMGISQDRTTETAKTIRYSIDDAMIAISDMAGSSGRPMGLTTGIAEMDKMTSGLQRGDMIVIAARPSMGKTSLAMNIAESVALNRDPKPVLFYSLEMSSEQLAKRLICGRAGVNMSRLRDGFLPRDKQKDIISTAKELRDTEILIDDSANLTMLDILARSRRVHKKMKNGLGLIIIDYLQLISPSAGSRKRQEEHVADISRRIKGMAKELNIPVVVLAQLNRESEKDKRRPKISDLRGSGAIEQDADVVIIIADSDDSADSYGEGERRVLIVAKHRNGPTGDVGVMFSPASTRFADA